MVRPSAKCFIASVGHPFAACNTAGLCRQSALVLPCLFHTLVFGKHKAEAYKGRSLPSIWVLYRDSTAERYSFMMKAMRFSMPSESQLDIHFNVDGTGVSRLAAKKGTERCLLKVTIEECECVLPCVPT
jgi:hypothetical protein